LCPAVEQQSVGLMHATVLSERFVVMSWLLWLYPKRLQGEEFHRNVLRMFLSVLPSNEQNLVVT
jgi:hypothetical protein